MVVTFQDVWGCGAILKVCNGKTSALDGGEWSTSYPG